MHQQHLSIFPKYLNGREQKQPLLVFDDLFRNQTEFPVWRQCLKTWLHGIFSDQPVWTGKSPADMLYDMEQFGRLIEAAWVISQNKPYPEPLNRLQEFNIIPQKAKDSPVMKYWRWDFYPRVLNEPELKNPYVVLDVFFEHRTLQLWIGELETLLKLCLSATPDYESLNTTHILKSFELLNMLLECSHLIYIREWSEPSTTTNSLIF